MCERYRCLNLSAVLYCNMRSDEYSFFPHAPSPPFLLPPLLFPYFPSLSYLHLTILYFLSPSPALFNSFRSPSYRFPYSSYYFILPLNSKHNTTLHFAFILMYCKRVLPEPRHCPVHRTSCKFLSLMAFSF